MIKYFKLIPVILLLLIASCKSSYEKALKSGNIETREALAWKYFQSKDYNKSAALFKSLSMDYAGSGDKLQEIFFHYALSNYHLGDYVAAGHEMKRLAQRFPGGKFTEQAYFYVAMSNFHMAPNFYLDQSYTYIALEDFQMFLDKYPRSEFVTEANNKSNELQKRIERKAYEKAYLYYKTENYQSAVNAFTRFLSDHPDSDKRLYVRYLQVECAAKFAKQSIEQKKVERYQEALTLANKYVEYIQKDLFNRNKYLNKTHELREDIEKNIESLKFTVPKYYFQRKSYPIAILEWKKLIPQLDGAEREKIEDLIVNAYYLNAFEADYKLKFEAYQDFVNYYQKLTNDNLKRRYVSQYNLAKEELKTLPVIIPIELNKQGRYAESQQVAKASLDSASTVNKDILDIWRQSTYDLARNSQVDNAENLFIELLEDAKLNGENKYSDRAKERLKDYPIVLVAQPFKDKNYPLTLQLARRLIKEQNFGEHRQEVVYLLIRSSYIMSKSGKKYERLPKLEQTWYYMNQYGSDLNAGKYAKKFQKMRRKVGKRLESYKN